MIPCGFKRLLFSHLLGLMLALSLSVASSNRTEAGLILEWDFSDNSGITLTEPAMPQIPEVTGMDFRRGSGLNPTRLRRGFGTSGWGGSEAGDFISFGLEVEVGYELQMESLQLRTVSTPLGPGNLGLYYSLDNFATPIQFISPSNSRFSDFTLDLSALGTLAGPVEFRIQQIGDESRIGTFFTWDFARFGVANFNGSTPVSLSGTLIEAIPEPNAAIFIIVCLAMSPLRRSRE